MIVGFGDQTGRVSLHGPAGNRIYETELHDPNGYAAYLTGGSAIDTDGTLAVAVGRWNSTGNTGLVFLDPSGKQTGFADTGRYIPTYLRYGPDRSLWAVGGQRDATFVNVEDREDYGIIRRYSAGGKEIGCFLPRSMFPVPGLSPGSTLNAGTSRIWVSNNRVAALLFAGSVAGPEWVEINYDGHLLGRWKLGSELVPSITLTPSEALYRRGTQHLELFDRVSATWKELELPSEDLVGLRGLTEEGYLMCARPVTDGVQVRWLLPQH